MTRSIRWRATVRRGWNGRASLPDGHIKVRYDDFTTVTRSHSVPAPTRDADAIAARAVALLEKTNAGVRPVRLLGVSMHNLANPDDPIDHPAAPPVRRHVTAAPPPGRRLTRVYKLPTRLGRRGAAARQDFPRDDPPRSAGSRRRQSASTKGDSQ